MIIKKKEGNGKFIWENGEYYIGEYLNDLKNGKGKIYYNNNSIKYDGDFVNDKFEGKGKFIWEFNYVTSGLGCFVIVTKCPAMSIRHSILS